MKYFITNFPDEKEAFLKIQKSFQEANKIIKKGGKDFISFEIEGKMTGEMLRNMRDLHNISRGAPEFVRRMSIIYLVTAFENFLGQVLRIWLLHHPESISADKMMKNQEILDCNDIGMLKNKIIDRELSALFYESIDGINKYLRGKVNLELDKKNEWSEFREVFYRRNLIVHNNCIANDEYRKNTAYTGADKLEIDQYYLKRAFQVFTDYSIIIARKFQHKKYNKRINTKQIELK